MYKETIENIKNCTNFAVSFPLSNRNICHRDLLLKRTIIALDIRHIEINSSSSAITVKAITHLLTYATAPRRGGVLDISLGGRGAARPLIP